MVINLKFEEINLDIDKGKLVDFLTKEKWPFHVNETITKEKIDSLYEDNFFNGSNNQCFWISNEGSETVGFLRLFDLDDVDDGYPLFDIRILSKYRGKGIGKLSVKWLCDYLFEKYSVLERIVGTTRVDNISMRKAFVANYFVKEGHFRNDWDSANGETFDTVQYGILRNDWETGKVTPVPWNDEV